MARYLRTGQLTDAAEPIHYGERGLPTFVIPLLILVAVLGYLAGHSSSKSAPTATLRTARSADLVVQYPRGWAQQSRGPRITGLTLTEAMLFAPRAAVSSAGLIVGSLPRGEPSPLPSAFVAKLSTLPQVALVDLIEAQAYRYTELRLPGFVHTLTIFVIPNPEGAATALACYAPSASSPYMRDCERTVAAVLVAGRSHGYQLTPEPKYAAEISATVDTLDRLRVLLKGELAANRSAARAEQLTRRLAGGFAEAGRSLSGLEPAEPVEQAQAVLVSAIEQARVGYESLASAAAAGNAAEYEAARTDVSRAEASVDQALQSYALLGYARS